MELTDRVIREKKLTAVMVTHNLRYAVEYGSRLLMMDKGQIVLDRTLQNKGIYPPISVLPSLSRLMKDGIGEGYTREDHQAVANQLFSSYAKVDDIRSLASVIGEDELSETDKKYLVFGNAFEEKFVGQTEAENRPVTETLDIGWKLLRILPKSELDRIDSKMLEKYYKGNKKSFEASRS